MNLTYEELLSKRLPLERTTIWDLRGDMYTFCADKVAHSFSSYLTNRDHIKFFDDDDGTISLRGEDPEVGEMFNILLDKDSEEGELVIEWFNRVFEGDS